MMASLHWDNEPLHLTGTLTLRFCNLIYLKGRGTNQQSQQTTNYTRGIILQVEEIIRTQVNFVVPFFYEMTYLAFIILHIFRYTS